MLDYINLHARLRQIEMTREIKFNLKFTLSNAKLAKVSSTQIRSNMAKFDSNPKQTEPILDTFDEQE